MEKVEQLLDALGYLFEEKIFFNSTSFSLNEHDELTDILIEILESIYQSVNMREIEKKVTQGSKIDLITFKSGCDLIENAQPKELALTQSKEKIIKIEPHKLIDNIKKFITEVEAADHRPGQLVILVRLEFTMDSDFERLLMTFNINNNIFNELKNLVLPKLKNVSDDEILLLWSKIKASIKNNSTDGFYIPYDDILPREFFDNKNQISNIRDKCAFFIVKYKPLITKKNGRGRV